MSNQLDKILKKSFEDAKKKPSNKVWEQIEKELLYKKQKRKIFWMRITAGIALLFGLSSFFYNSFQGDAPIAGAITKNTPELLVDANDASNDTPIEEKSLEKIQNENTLLVNTKSDSEFSNSEKSIAAKLTENIKTTSSSTVDATDKTNRSLQHNNTFEGILASNDLKGQNRNETIIVLEPQKKKLSTTNHRNIKRSSENYYDRNALVTTEPSKYNGEKIYTFTGNETNNSQWALGGFYAADSPEEYELQNTGTALSSVNGEASFQSTQSFSRGVTVAYKINDKFEVNTGITMANRSGFSEGNANFYASTEISTNIGTVDNEGFNTNEYSGTDQFADLITDKNFESINTIDYQFLEIPLTLQYNFFESNKIKSFVNTGMSAQIGSEYTVTSNDGLVLESQSDIPTQMNALFGAGFEYKIHKKIGFRLNPMMKLYLGNREFTSGDRYFMSFNTGLNYNF